MSRLVQVAVPVPLGHAFTYAVPETTAEVPGIGTRVLVDFGKRRVVGVVLRSEGVPAPIGFEVKEIRGVVDSQPVLPAELLAFLEELAAYTLSPIGEVLRLALPAVERGQLETLGESRELFGHLKGTKKVSRPMEMVAEATTVIEDSAKLRGQTLDVLRRLRANGRESIAHLEKAFTNARSAVKRLEKLGLVTISEVEKHHDVALTGHVTEDEPKVLTVAQTEAAEAIARSAGDPASAKGFLLWGVTGSGKTEVYFHAIRACLDAGRGVLVMVPEIALTPQLLSRFRGTFGDGVAILHSGLSDRDRHTMWKRLHAKEVRVAIGARSALFAPIPELGLIVVDEEHDGSFKQEEGVRYHARDMAILRAHRAHATIVLGSATPSLESISLAEKGKLTLLRLKDRARSSAALPEVELIDLRRNGPGPSGDKLLSLPLHRAIEKTLARKEQVILFLNRRGFAPSIVCMSCGSIESCADCSVSLTYHRSRGSGRMKCHYCGFEANLVSECSSCHAKAISLEGLGTEKLESVLAESFSGAKVARLDRDVTKKTSSDGVLDRMRRGEIDILVGTQMVTKGHDLPNVTLVGVINADSALSMPDFRAAERTFQLLVQVAGRAGRHDKPGRVLIQTRTPEHAALRFARNHDVDGFLHAELADRKETHYPPCARLALLRVDAIDEKEAEQVARALAEKARQSADVQSHAVEVMGPAAAPIARLRGRFHFRVMLRAKERPELRRVLAELGPILRTTDRRVRAIIDVDPVSML